MAGLDLVITRSRLFIYLVLLLIYLSTLYVILWHLGSLGYLIMAIDYSRLLTNLSTNGDGAITSVDANEEFPLYRVVPPDVIPDVNMFFTIKTTPKNYQRRIGISKMTWFQYVDRRMITLVSDYINDTFEEEKGFERELVDEGYRLLLANCTIAHNTESLCCKTGIEFKEYYDYLDMHENDTNLPQWFCHLDDDVYVNVQQFKRLLSKYNSSKPYYVGRHYCCAKGMNRVRLKRHTFWHASGPTYCMSLPLMKQLQPYISGSQTYLNTCNIVGYPDEFSVGAIIGLVFGYNITHTNLIDYDRISYAKSSLAQISRMCTINYKSNKVNGIPSDTKFNHVWRLFDRSRDPVGLLSLHCLLNNETDWCPHKQ